VAQGQPFGLIAPIHILVGFPNVFTAARKTKSAEPGGFQGYVSGQYHKVGPRYFLSVFLFDGPQQTTGLVQAHVVGPRVERSKALLTTSAPTTSVTGAIGSCTVP